MADDPKTPPPNPDPSAVGVTGAVLAAANFANRLTLEKLFAFTIIIVMGFMVYDGQTGMNQREATMARRYDESREQDRRHCDDREEKMARVTAERDEKMRAWFASQSDLQRRHDADRDDKMSRSFTERDEKVRGILAMILGKLESLKGGP